MKSWKIVWEHFFEIITIEGIKNYDRMQKYIIIVNKLNDMQIFHTVSAAIIWVKLFAEEQMREVISPRKEVLYVKGLYPLVN